MRKVRFFYLEEGNKFIAVSAHGIMRGTATGLMTTGLHHLKNDCEMLIYVTRDAGMSGHDFGPFLDKKDAERFLVELRMGNDDYVKKQQIRWVVKKREEVAAAEASYRRAIRFIERWKRVHNYDKQDSS